MEKMRNGIIECAIIRTPFHSVGFECVYGKEEPLMAAGIPSFFSEISTEKIKLTELSEKPLIYYRRFDAIISTAFQNIGIEPHIFCRNDDARTCLQWAKSGLGVALIPRSICQGSNGDELVLREIDSEDTVTRIAAVYKKNGYVSNIAREFVTCFEKQI
jgi:DNA-binding transcriptional LysR family regulator